MEVRLLVGKVLYGALFCVLLPFFLFFWMNVLPVDLPIGNWQPLGYFLLTAGATLLIIGMSNLWFSGGGLPMNAYPPVNYVARGAFKIVKHPIYTGFCMALAGLSIILHSPSGLYFITPLLIVLTAALVLGYEKHDLQKRFGAQKHPTLFSLPEANDLCPPLIHRFRIFTMVFIPWLVLYELLIFFNVGRGFINTMLPFESRLGVFTWMVIPYSLTYLFVALSPFVIRTNKALRHFALLAWYTSVLGLFIQYIVPHYTEARTIQPASLLAQWIMLEQQMDGQAASFPSFHALWGLVAGHAWIQRFPDRKYSIAAFTLLIVVSCVAIGVHSVIDVAAAIILFVVVHKRKQLWNKLNYYCEQIANSWAEVRFGKFRIINHCIYAGASGCVGVVLLAQLSVPVEIIIVVTLGALIGGAVWGQWIEGSGNLLRPFGYYGAILGGLLAVCGACAFYQTDIFRVLAAIALSSPWVQAIGRIRCLVQGCCHGRATGSVMGIRYENPHSRVCKRDELIGKNLHNTQLYSILSNIVIGLVLCRLYVGEVPLSMITGLYFILTGAARFVEEAYRGEWQTKFVHGLRVYQWLAIGAILFGMLLTCISSGFTPILQPRMDWTILSISIGGGFVWAFAMGMDFPHSTIKFSRLSD